MGSARRPQHRRGHPAERHPLQRGLPGERDRGRRRRHRDRRESRIRPSTHEGAGNVAITRNLIQGNLGGAADGGGIALRFVNGQEVRQPAQLVPRRHRAEHHREQRDGPRRGGISPRTLPGPSSPGTPSPTTTARRPRSTRSRTGPTDPTTPQVAGIVSRPHSAVLAEATGQASSVPAELSRNIVWPAGRTSGRGGDPEPAAGHPVLPRPVAGAHLHAVCFLSANGDPGSSPPYVNALHTAAAADEGGNFVQVLFTPLARTGNYTTRRSLRRGAPDRRSSIGGVRPGALSRRAGADRPDRTPESHRRSTPWDPQQWIPDPSAARSRCSPSLRLPRAPGRRRVQCPRGTPNGDAIPDLPSAPT